MPPALKSYKKSKLPTPTNDLDEVLSLSVSQATHLAHHFFTSRTPFAQVRTWADEGDVMAMSFDRPFAVGQSVPRSQDVAAYQRVTDDESLLSISENEDGPETDGIIGSSSAMHTVLRQVRTVAPLDSTVLIQGETGTGKELVASAIHNLSSRSRNNFIRFNCAAVPSGLLESELFGHERGAFTGALTRRLGRFELADRGTLFLDEIGDMPLELQAKLLRVLQEQEFERLGSTQTQRVNVRVIAATNCDLKKMMVHKQFRTDLYFRLNVFPIEIPPLRDRREDIPELVRAFIKRFASRMKRRIEFIPESTIDALTRYDWPGNIRELQNFIERSVILSLGGSLRAPLESLSSALPATTASARPATLEEEETRHIVSALEELNWVIGGPKGAAERLGLKRTTLIAKMRRLGITRPELGAAILGNSTERPA